MYLVIHDTQCNNCRMSKVFDDQIKSTKRLHKKYKMKHEKYLKTNKKVDTKLHIKIIH